MSYSRASDWFCSNDGSAFGSGAAAGCALSLIGVVCSHSYTYPDHHNQKPRVSPPAKPPKKNRIEHPNRGPPLPPALTRQKLKLSSRLPFILARKNCCILPPIGAQSRQNQTPENQCASRNASSP